MTCDCGCQVLNHQIETARLFSASTDRFEITNSIRVSQPTAVNWPDVPMPKPEKRAASASETRKVASARATKKPSPKKTGGKGSCEPSRQGTPLVVKLGRRCPLGLEKGLRLPLNPIEKFVETLHALEDAGPVHRTSGLCTSNLRGLRASRIAWVLTMFALIVYAVTTT
jgi:hypothetical protein